MHLILADPRLTHKTVQHYADILTGTFMIRQLKPRHENISKRRVKSPKIYIRDTGVFALLDIENHAALLVNQKLGASGNLSPLNKSSGLILSTPMIVIFGQAIRERNLIC